MDWEQMSMKSMIESCIAANDPGFRPKNELLTLLPWFRRYGKDVLNKLSDDVLTEILQRCNYKKFKKDHIIITQGDLGDSFYILIEGQIGIYVKDIDHSNEESKIKRPSLFGRDNRNLLGTCVLVEGEGYSFGEYALMDQKGLRKASVIANDDCCLISIDVATYNDCLKNIQNDILLEREQFIMSHALFGKFDQTIKELIKLSLKKISAPFQTNLITQGDKWNGLIFIRKGSGSLTIDADKHGNQYPELFPLDFTIYEERYKQFPELKPPPSTADRSEEECVEGLCPKVIRLKRAGDYAALERHIFNHNKRICTVQCGEIIGDLELLFGLKTNLYSITCIEKIDAFILESVHIERLRKRIDSTLLFEHLKDVIRSKLNYRERYFIEIPIPLMLFFKQKLYDKKFQIVKEFPKMRTEKVLPTNEEEWQHLLQMYEKDKAPLFPPYTRCSVYLKDLMSKKANERQRVKGIQMTEMDADIQLTGNSVDYYPLTQQNIYRLQARAKDSVNFMELIVKELKKAKVKRPNIVLQLLSRSVTKDSIGSTKNPELLAPNLNRSMESPRINISRGNNMKKKSEHRSTEIISRNSVSTLQNSQIQFLNTLCSDKSRYEIRLNNPEQNTNGDFHTHYLPSLQAKSDEIKTKDVPRKGAKVFVKPRPCDALTSPYRLIGHSHNNYKILEKIDAGSINKIKHEL